MNNGLKVFAGFLTGALAGAAMGLLLAPNSGKKTRKMLAREARELEKDLETKAKKGIRKAKDTFNDSVEEWTESGKEVVGNLKENLKELTN